MKKGQWIRLITKQMSNLKRFKHWHITNYFTENSDHLSTDHTFMSAERISDNEVGGNEKGEI